MRCAVGVQLYSFACKYTIIICRKDYFFPVNYLGTFAQSHWTINGGFISGLSVLFPGSVHLPHVHTRMVLISCLCHKVWDQEMWVLTLYSFPRLFWILKSLAFLHDFGISLSIGSKKTSWNFAKGSIEYVDKFGEYWHLYNIKSSGL